MYRRRTSPYNDHDGDGGCDDDVVVVDAGGVVMMMMPSLCINWI